MLGTGQPSPDGMSFGGEVLAVGRPGLAFAAGRSYYREKTYCPEAGGHNIPPAAGRRLRLIPRRNDR